MRVALRKLGNSSGVIIPKPLLDEMGIGVGDAIEMTCEQGRLLLAPLPRAVRADWAAASKALADADDDALAWPEFGNVGDPDLSW